MDVRSEWFRSYASQLSFIHAVCHANSVDFKVAAVAQYHGIEGGVTTDVGSAVCDEKQCFLAGVAGLGYNFFNGLIESVTGGSASRYEVQIF